MRLVNIPATEIFWRPSPIRRTLKASRWTITPRVINDTPIDRFVGAWYVCVPPSLCTKICNRACWFAIRGHKNYVYIYIYIVIYAHDIYIYICVHNLYIYININAYIYSYINYAFFFKNEFKTWVSSKKIWNWFYKILVINTFI